MDLATSLAAQVWCRPETSSKVMDPVLCQAFAEVLREVLTQPWLGNATTKQLLDEVAARVDLDYRTVD